MESLKDILKAIGGALASPKPSQDVPGPLSEAIQSLLDKEPAIDDETSNRVHEELSNHYKKHVATNRAKTGAFLQVLCLLRVFITRESQKLYWYKVVILPTLDDVGRLRVELERASSFMLAMLDYDPDDDKDGSQAKESRSYARMLLESYTAHTGDEVSLEQEHIAGHFEHVLISYGKSKPRDFMIVLDDMIFDKDLRAQALGLLTALVSEQPPHLHHVSKTPLIEHLLQCLMIDTSTTVVQMALTALVMFLPHIPTSAKAHLPRLFLIYSRLLCWDQVPKSRLQEGATEEASEDEEEETQEETTEGWQKLFGSQEAEESASLDVTHYFTFLYGLYPLNFTAFIRKPRRYLKDIKFPRAEQLDLDQDLIHQRTDVYRRRHLMHPNFYLTGAEDELEEERFATVDASDVVAKCIGLVSILPTEQPARGIPLPASTTLPPSSVETKDIPGDSLLAGDEDASTVAESTASTTDSVAAARAKAVSRQASSQEFRASQPLQRPPADEHLTQTPVALLRRQVLILQNELNYERYLKQQHLSHIGQLQRRHVDDSTVSASVENLMALNKSLRSKLTKLNEAFAVLKKEKATGRAQSKEFEMKLNSKVRSLRDAEKVWTREREELNLEVSKLQSDNETLRQLVVDSEARELLSKQKTATMDFALERAKDIQKRHTELETKARDQESKAWTYEQSAAKLDAALMDLEAMKMQIASERAQSEQMRVTYEQKVASLLTHPTKTSDTGEQSPKVLEMIEKANRAANARFAQLSKDHAVLKHENARLELQCRESPWASRGARSAGRPERLHITADSESSTHPSTPPQEYFDDEDRSAPMSAPVGLVTSASDVGRMAGESSDFYKQERSAHSAESLDSGTVDSSSKGRKSGSSRGMMSRIGGSSGTRDGDKKKKKAAQAKAGGIRGIRGLM